MKNFTQARILSVSLSLLLVAMLLVSSCTSPQHFSFTAAPPAYQKVKKENVASAETGIEAQNTLTASTQKESVVLPEIAKLSAVKTQNKTVAATAKTSTTEAQPKQKLNLVQKVALKKLQKQVAKIQKKGESEKAQAAGPVTNRSAIALILIGFLAILFGALLGIGVFYTLGALVVFIGLVLLILNYI